MSRGTDALALYTPSLWPFPGSRRSATLRQRWGEPTKGHRVAAMRVNGCDLEG
jgi:hypothetical protein